MSWYSENSWDSSRNQEVVVGQILSFAQLRPGEPASLTPAGVWPIHNNKRFAGASHTLQCGRREHPQDQSVHLCSIIPSSRPAKRAGRVRDELLHALFQRSRLWEWFYLFFITDVAGRSFPGDGGDRVSRSLAGQRDLVLQLHGSFVLHVGDFRFCWKGRAIIYSAAAKVTWD